MFGESVAFWTFRVYCNLSDCNRRSEHARAPFIPYFLVRPINKVPDS